MPLVLVVDYDGIFKALNVPSSTGEALEALEARLLEPLSKGLGSGGGPEMPGGSDRGAGALLAKHHGQASKLGEKE